MEKKASEEFKFLKLLVEKKALYFVAAALFALFLLTKLPLFVLTAAGVLAATLVIESYVGAKSTSWKKEVTETVIAIAVAAVVWFSASYLLNTQAPLDAVVSCSMLPNLERGDIVVLQGKEPAAPRLQLSEKEWGAISESGELHYACSVCIENQTQRPCLINPVTKQEVSPMLVEYDCGVCQQQKNTGEKEYVICVKSITLGGQEVSENLSNDIVVYDPLPGDLFALTGDIIHRVYAVVQTENNSYLLIKGDNNAGFDVQAYYQGLTNNPVPRERLKGVVIARLPYIGYFKLFVAGLFQPQLLATPPGCDAHLIH